jgi:enolase
MKISRLNAREILASGGYPTVEAIVTLEDGTKASASVPYGASAGSHEATVLTDGDGDRYNGKGVKTVIANIEAKISPEIVDRELSGQRQLDEIMIELDGTDNKANLGGNAILAVSVAYARAMAKSKDIELYEHIRQEFDLPTASELPNPMIVAIEGGKHAHQSSDLQEYCLLGLRDDGPAENIRRCLETYHSLRKTLEKAGFSTNVGNEGAFAPNNMKTNEQPLQFLVEAIEAAGYQPGVDIGIAIDAAASEFYGDGKYNLSIESKMLTSEELIDYYLPWFDKYPIITVEDMLHEDDWQAWTKLTGLLKEKGVVNIGDDLTVTNKKRLQTAIEKEAITAILIKLNQIGSLTETVDTCILAAKNNMFSVPSHRGGGETNDAAMIDLAVAVGAKYVKVGPTRGERVAKYNRLLEIEAES